MSNQSDHKRGERWHLEQLARALPGLFDKQWEDGPEPPDFECMADGNRIGLEFTRYELFAGVGGWWATISALSATSWDASTKAWADLNH